MSWDPDDDDYEPDEQQEAEVIVRSAPVFTGVMIRMPGHPDFVIACSPYVYNHPTIPGLTIQMIP